ncbi:DEAD/DEAH box helicase [Mesorhizobium sp. KR9-304]|uniref:DEAD/DEAH box helicase n=1 Tax=Mesorhizobium sp. KR9-304 TaxID=3156614 RepID=UPI0032B46269
MSYTLHPHQIEAMALLRESLKSGRKRPMLQAVTGFGKTILAATIIEAARARNRRVIFCVPAISLIDQTVEKFVRQGISCVGVMQGQHPATDAAQPVQVASVQTLQRRKLPVADLVLIDEAHLRFRFVSDWMRRPEWAEVPFIGLSATPWSRGLGQDYDDLIVGARLPDLIEQGFLSPFRVFAPCHPDLSKVRTVAGDFREDDLALAMNQPTLVANAVSTWLAHGEDRPTLLFAVDRAHARRLAEEFEAAGVPTGYVDAKTPREERQAIGRRLHHGQIKVVCNVGCLTTGIDWDVRCISLVRPTKSEMLFVQIIGRGLRTAVGKDDCIVLDHSDTTLRLGFPTDIHHDTLDNGRSVRARAKGRERATPLPRECPSCSRLKPAGVHACPSCGFAPERQSAILERDGQLVAISGSRKAEPTHDQKQTFYGMLLAYQRERGYNAGYVAHKFRERFGVWPRGLADRLVPPDITFLGWIKSRQIAFAKGRQRGGQANAA